MALPAMAPYAVAEALVVTIVRPIRVGPGFPIP